MKSELNSSQHMLVLAAALISHGIFAAENTRTIRCLLPALPARAGSVAEPPTATDTGAPQSASAVPSTELPPLKQGVTELKFSEFFRQPVGPRGLEFTQSSRARRKACAGLRLHEWCEELTRATLEGTAASQSPPGWSAGRAECLPTAAKPRF